MDIITDSNILCTHRCKTTGFAINLPNVTNINQDQISTKVNNIDKINKITKEVMLEDQIIQIKQI